MFQRILFPVDFSPRSTSIAGAVRAYANASGAEVYLVHVLELPELVMTMPEFPAYMPPDMQAVYRDNAAIRLRRCAEEALPGVTVHEALLEGEPASEIAQFAAENNIDLLMIPTHGVGGFRRFLIGSTTAKILHDVRCPVWTSVHDETDHGDHHHLIRSPRNVVCGVDFAPTSDAVIAYADVFAKRTGAEVTLVHAVPKISSRPTNYMDVDFDAHMTQEAKLRADEVQARLGTSYPVLFVPGDPADVLREAVEKTAADLAIVGRSHLMEGFASIQSHTYDVINKCPCPVLSV
ncbi:universal stress protein [Bryobacterales bacterium F-183]|nr:universal stress protein [Bryobacterales bacterium F-183]